VYSVCSVGTSYKIGVDGGGSKTELILVDSAGTIVARHTAPGCNPSQIGPESARAILNAALTALLAQSQISNLKSGISASLFCMAGHRAFWRETADELAGFGRITTTDDSFPVLELATDGAPGLVLHAGTGSFVAARAPDGTIHYTGGLGWKLGDPGSGYDLGRRAIAAAMLELQTHPDVLSPLAAALCAHTGLRDYPAHSRFFYNDPTANARITAFAPRVLELAAQDCAPARLVLTDSLGDLARLADGVIHRVFPAGLAAGPAGPEPGRTGHTPSTPVPCGISGRLLNSPPAAAVLRALAGKLNWPVALRFIDTAPIEGVRRLLVRM